LTDFGNASNRSWIRFGCLRAARVISRFQFGGAGDERNFWLMLCLLLLAVLLPTAGLLYFINEAVNGQRNMARQELGEAYLGQLRLISTQLDSFWEQRARELDSSAAGERPSIFFEHCVRDHLADSVICLNSDGSPAYPALAAAPLPDPTARQSEWVEARSLEDAGRFADAAGKYAGIAESAKDLSAADRASQARIRCLVRSGQTSLAIREIDGQFFTYRGAFGASPDGRMIAADEQMYYLQLSSAHVDERYSDHAARLQRLLQNYGQQIPSAQRLFLMDHMRALPLGPARRLFPTYQAERIAERVLSEGRAIQGDAALQMSGIADIWKMRSRDGTVIALYSTKTILTATRGFLEPRNWSRDPVFSLTPPGQPTPAHKQWMAAGSRLPGWQISMNATSMADSGGGAQRQIASYLWIGFLTIATAAALAILGGQTLRRQMRIAHLKTDLVAAVSHELKTPLASMKLLVESLLSGEQFEPKRTRQYLQLVARENSRLSRLIDNFLTFSRMERKRGRIDFARIQPASVARAAIDSIGDRFPVNVEIADPLPPLYADADALVTVLLNLLENAYKYTDENRRIDLGVSFSGGRICFAVKDNGIGLTEKEQKKIFRRFYQVDGRLTRQTGGVGLGLSIVEFIVKAHRGVVSVASRPGAGSTFVVSLPPSSSAEEAAA
jgi:signal transduction histidine kinase